MVACACVAVVRVARGALGRPVTTMDAHANVNANAWRFLGGDDDGARGATCVDRAMDAVEKCARETMDVARRAEGESVEEAVRALAEARARCAADARDVVDACAEDARACAKTLRAIEEECEVRAREMARTCESGGAWACAMKAAESSRECASRVAAEAAACVDDDDGDDALDDPDDPDDDRAKCEAERKELEQECHDAYDEIKRKIRDGEISFIEGMKQLAKLGKTCASKAMALRKKCRPPPPPRVAVTA